MLISVIFHRLCDSHEASCGKWLINIVINSLRPVTGGQLILFHTDRIGL